MPDAPDVPQTPTTPAAAPQPAPGALKGIKETVESILIAFILAFVFRAFIVEAFVIPTGSMATTLLGANMRFTCKECGYRFTVNYSDPNRGPGSDINIPARAKGAVDAWCPNCRYQVQKPDRDNPVIHYGDRILVLKYIYLVSPASRWDVVVFKDPTYQPEKPEEKTVQWYSQNYIKRLVGLPGETLMILDGDIYVKEGESWVIQTKPRHAQEAMWRVVYDHDHRPMNRNRNDWQMPWVAVAQDNGWKLHTDDSASRAFDFDRMNGSGAIRFDDSHGPSYFTDWLAYNPNNPGYRRDYPVSDLKLAFTYERQAGTGSLRASLSKRDVTFVVEIKDQVQVFRREPKKNPKPGEDAMEQTPLLPRAFPLKATDSLRVEMMNVDHQFTLRLNGEVICESKYKPDVEKIMSERAGNRPNVTIEAQDQKARISHVSLWRDVYYTPHRGPGSAEHGSPAHPVILNSDFGKREYFVLGDNSEQSADARFWEPDVSLPNEDLETAAGRVPERFMLGKAFFVYWPAGYKPFTDEAPGIVPNFGEMRLIH